MPPVAFVRTNPESIAIYHTSSHRLMMAAGKDTFSGTTTRIYRQAVVLYRDQDHTRDIAKARNLDHGPYIP